MNMAQINESYALRKERSEFFPQDFKRCFVPISTAPESDIPSWFSGLPVVKTPAWEFSSSYATVRALKPVSVKVTRGETLFFVENETLDIFATGETREEAIRAFNDHLIYFYNHYKNLSWDRVTGEAERLKRLYEDLFQDVT